MSKDQHVELNDILVAAHELTKSGTTVTAQKIAKFLGKGTVKTIEPKMIEREKGRDDVVAIRKHGVSEEYALATAKEMNRIKEAATLEFKQELETAHNKNLEQEEIIASKDAEILDLKEKLKANEKLLAEGLVERGKLLGLIEASEKLNEAQSQELASRRHQEPMRGPSEDFLQQVLEFVEMMVEKKYGQNPHSDNQGTPSRQNRKTGSNRQDQKTRSRNKCGNSERETKKQPIEKNSIDYKKDQTGFQKVDTSGTGGPSPDENIRQGTVTDRQTGDLLPP